MHPKAVKILQDAKVNPETVQDVDCKLVENVDKNDLCPRGKTDVYAVLHDGTRVKIYEYTGRRVNTQRSRYSMSAALGEITTEYDPPETLKRQWKGVLGLN